MAKKTKKTLCKECGGTGLRGNEDEKGVICKCPAGRARDAADYSWGMFE